MKLAAAISLASAIGAHAWLPYGHRGYSAPYPENTIRAFQESLDAGASVELDVQVSADGQVVVIHDSTVQRTTDGSGRVNDLAWSEMENLDAGSWKGAEFAGEKLPLLSDALEWWYDRPDYEEFELMLDTKNVSPTIVPQMVEALSRYPANDKIVVGCWNTDCMRQFQEAAPEVPIFVIGSLPPSPNDFGEYRALGVSGFHINHNFLSRTSVQDMQEADFRAYTWTVNSVNDINKCVGFEVDGIFGDYVDRLMAAKNGEVSDETEMISFADSREASVVQACKNVNRFGAMFPEHPTVAETFFLESFSCKLARDVCSGDADESRACQAIAARLVKSFDEVSL